MVARISCPRCGRPYPPKSSTMLCDTCTNQMRFEAANKFEAETSSPPPMTPEQEAEAVRLIEEVGKALEAANKLPEHWQSPKIDEAMMDLAGKDYVQYFVLAAYPIVMELRRNSCTR